MITTTRPVAVHAGGAFGEREGPGEQPGGQRLREGGFAHDAVEHADGRDADLHRGQELGGVLVQVHGGLRAGSPVSTMTCRRALRLAVSAISDIAKMPLSKIRKIKER
jgi:hypothetical protein